MTVTLRKGEDKMCSKNITQALSVLKADKIPDKNYKHKKWLIYYVNMKVLFRDGWQTLVNAVVNLRVPYSAGKFLAS